MVVYLVVMILYTELIHKTVEFLNTEIKNIESKIIYEAHGLPLVKTPSFDFASSVTIETLLINWPE
jgi:hypothetical protein